MTKPLVIFLLFLSSICVGQKSDFSANFKADSLGINGFRKESIVSRFDTVLHPASFKASKLKGYRKDKVLALLGKPNRIDTLQDKVICFRYYLQKDGIYSGTFDMLLNFKNNKVKEVKYDTKPVQEMPFTDAVVMKTDPLPVTYPIIKLVAVVMTARIRGKDTIHTNIADTAFIRKDSLEKYIIDRINYPEMEKEALITGIEYVSFILKKDGSVTNVKIVRGIPGGPGIGREVLRVLNSIHKLKPKKEKGYPVEVIYGLSIKFALRQ
jgi:hypothetical protein